MTDEINDGGQEYASAWDQPQAEALRSLIEKVRDGGCRHYVIEEAAYATLKREDKITPQGRALPALMAQAYTGSLDAAKALHEALLPGWRWVVAEGATQSRAAVQKSITVAEIGASDAVPARAWLLAILKAKLAEGSK